MSLTVETGAIVAGAESYVTVAEATTYHGNRGNALWAGTDAVKEAALRKAAAYLDGRYRNRWKGRRVQPVVQPMEWPRGGVCVGSNGIIPSGSASYDIGMSGEIFISFNSIPQRLKSAQCELAVKALDGDLAGDTVTGVKREKVDVIETEYFTADSGREQYNAVEQLISDFLMPLGCSDLARG